MRVRVELVFTPEESDSDRFVVTIEDEEADAATVELELEKAHEQLMCTAVTVRKQQGVVSRDVRIPVDRYLDLVTQHPALAIQGAPAQRRRKRRVLTDEFLSDVADAYTSGGRSVSAVKERHAASDSQVFRWLKAARERGLLTEEVGDDGER